MSNIGKEWISYLAYNNNTITFIKNRFNHGSHLTFPDNEKGILLGQNVEDLALNYLLLCFKYFIYKCKHQEIIPEIKQFQYFFRQKIKIEMESFKLGMNLETYEKMWHDFDPAIFWM